MPTVLSIHRGTSHTRDLVLSKNGYEVLAAEDLYRAAELFRSGTIDAVVLDAGLSLSTVAPFASVLKMARPNVPLLLVADNADEAENDPGQPYFDQVISRPDGPLVLLERLRDLIAGTQRRTASGLQAAGTTVNNTQELRQRMQELRQKLQRTRELSQRMRDRKPPA